MSPILFIVYLAEALKPTRSIATPSYVEDHRYSQFSTRLFIIDQQYADDTLWVTNDEERKDALKDAVPPIPGERNLQANESKTEEYVVTRGGDDSWRKCKYLGSLLDSENDINKRKILSLSAYNQLKYIFENKGVSQDEVIQQLSNKHTPIQ